MRLICTPTEKLTEVLRASIGIEKNFRDNHKDIPRALPTREKIQQFINKYSLR